MSSNQLHTVPIIEGEDEILISGSKILSFNSDDKPKRKVFYGPGQGFDVGEDKYYKHPDRWPNKFVLRVPQVVWIVLNFPYTFQDPPESIPEDQESRDGLDAQDILWAFSNYFTFPIYTYVSSLTFQYHGICWSNNKVEQWTNGYQFPSGPPGTVIGPGAPPTFQQYYRVLTSGTESPGFGWYNHFAISSQNNPFKDEVNRLTEIANSVKALIENSRKGRTFVDVINIFKPSVVSLPSISYTGFIKKYFDDTYLGVDEDGFSKIFGENYLWHMISPSTSDPYFGVDFLMIFLGVPGTTVSPLLPSTTFYRNTQFGAPAAKEISQPLFDSALRKFARYNVKMYGLDLQFSEFEKVKADSYVGVTPPPLRVNQVYGGGPNDFSLVDWFLFSPQTPQQQLNAQASAFNSALSDEISYLNEDWQQFVEEEWQNQASSLPNTHEYLGKTSQIESASDLISLIKGHYNFG